MKIIIVGTGKVGSLLVEQLSQEGHQIVAVDKNEKKLLDLQNALDVLCLQGSAISRELLMEAGADSADLAIAATDSDEINMLCCLLAKKLGVAHTIARVRRYELSEEIDLFSDDMGLSMTINPEYYAAQEIFSVLRFPGLASVESFGHGMFEMVEFRLAAEGPATAMTLHQLGIKYNSRALVCAVRRGGTTIIPNGDDSLQAGDIICFAAEPAEAEHFLELCGIKRRSAKHVIIVGAGQITYYLVRMLNQIGVKPVVIENDKDKAESLSQTIPELLVINADGTDRDILDEEGLDSADAFISLTGTDEVNVLMGMYAQSEGVPKVVTKISRSGILDIIDAERAGSIVCPRDIISNRVISYVRARDNASGSKVETMFRIAGQTVEALEFIVDSEYEDLTGIPLKDLKLRSNLLLCAIFRGGSVIIPRGNDTIEPGDHVILATTISHLNDLSMILQQQ